MLADIICYYKMTSFMALDGVTPFLRLKYLTNTCKPKRYIQSNYWGEYFSARAESLKKLKSSNVFSSIIVC